MIEFWTVTMIEAYQESRLDEIQRPYSVRLVRPRRRRLHQQLLAQIGDLLVRAGHGLQARYPRTIGTGCETCQPAVGQGKA